MRILIIGQNHAAKAFANLLSEDKNNIIFANFKDTEANFVDISMGDVEEFKEFALANEINLTILCDIGAIEGGANFEAVFNEAGLSIFAPDKGAVKLSSSKGFAKKFMYRNRFKTPQFQIFDNM